MKRYTTTEVNMNTLNVGMPCRRLFLPARISCCLVFIALCCLLCSVPAYAVGGYQTVEVESLRVAIDTEWCSQTAPGYWPVRFDITNLGKDRVIEIRGQGSRWWDMGESGSFEIRQSIRLKRSDHVMFTVPVPISADHENLQFRILERGRILQAFNPEGLQSNQPPEQTGVLIVADPSTPFGAMASSLPRSVRAFPGAVTAKASMPALDLILDPLRFPSNWIGLTSVYAVFIGPKEWEKLTVPQKEALLVWTASGGDFMFVDGDLATLLPDPKVWPVNLTLSPGNPAPYYFGRIHLIKPEDLRTNGLEYTLTRASMGMRTSDYALPVNRSSDWLEYSGHLFKSPVHGMLPKVLENGFRLPIPGIGGAPVRSYFLILLLFSVLIGPVNYVWLRRKRRQILFVLTVPLISAAFILLLSGYAILGEGFDVTGRAESFTLLDQRTNHAATRAIVSMYAAGMAPGNGLQFSRGVAVFPYVLFGSGSQERDFLDLTELQQYSAGFIRARAPANFNEVSFRAARERLNFSHTEDGITVVNALGKTITRLSYRDAGKIFTLDLPLKAGGKALLHAAEPSILSNLPSQFDFLREIRADRTYIAWLETSPFLETGVPDVKERDSLHLVLGYVGEEP
jgi:hypothetical protein